MSYYYATQILTGGTDAGTHKEGDVKNDCTYHNLCGGLLVLFEAKERQKKV